MQPENPIVLLAGSDPDLLVLRSSVLAAAGIWSLRVRTADQAFQVVGMVPFDLAIICYTLDQADKHRLCAILAGQNSPIKVILVAPGDDCSGTNFLRRVEEALAGPYCEVRPNFEPPQVRPPVVR